MMLKGVGRIYYSADDLIYHSVYLTIHIYSTCLKNQSVYRKTDRQTFSLSRVPMELKMGGDRYFSKEIAYLTHTIWGLQSLKLVEVTYIWTQLWEKGR